MNKVSSMLYCDVVYIITALQYYYYDTMLILLRHYTHLQTIIIMALGRIGVARIFDWGGPNHKSHAITSSEIFKKGTFSRAKIS